MKGSKLNFTYTLIMMMILTASCKDHKTAGKAEGGVNCSGSPLYNKVW